MFREIRVTMANEIPISCSSLVFQAQPLEQALLGVRRLGFVDVDLGVLEGWTHIYPSELADDFDAVLRRVRDAAAAAEVRIVALNCGMGDADVERRARATMQLARELSVETVTFGAPPPGLDLDLDLEGAIAWAQPILAATREHATIPALVEFHSHTFTEVVDDCVALVEATGLGVTFDTSHYWIGPAQGRGLERLLPHIRHMHVRDAGTTAEQHQLAWGTGAVDLPLVAHALREAGYRGRVSIEYEGDDPDSQDPFEGDMEQSVLDAAAAVRAAWS